MNTEISFIDSLRYKIKSLDFKYQQYRSTTNETVVADTEYGKVKGVKRMTIYDDPYYSFEKIPFAQPPVGELRFKAPQRPTPWTDVRDCTHYGSKPYQKEIGNKIDGSEDCLYLNVYTNNMTPEKPRAVMVYIYGGGFIMGEANREWYGPEYFMKKDVILITIQYRLGPLGFLSLKDPALNIPGNAGLKDQLLALKWVKNNCAHFGGNPDCITLFGESAGASSTHYLMINEQAKGLFHRAILMSGTSLCSWAWTECTPRALALAKAIGYTGDDNEKNILDYLLTAKPKELVTGSFKVLTPEERQKRVMFSFGPTVEPYETTDCMVPKFQVEMMRNAWSSTVPILMGCCSNEALFQIPDIRKNSHLIKDMEDCVAFVPHEIWGGPDKQQERIENGMKLRKAHVPDGKTATQENYLDLLCHMYFWHALHRTVMSRFKHGSTAPMFLYRFDFESENLINPYRYLRWGKGVRGVSHTDELSYLFSSCLGRRMSKNSREYRTIERMIGIWTTFAETGNPNSAEIDGLGDTVWEPLKKDEKDYKCLNISDELRYMELPEMEKMKAWDTLYDNHPDLLC